MSIPSNKADGALVVTPLWFASQVLRKWKKSRKSVLGVNDQLAVVEECLQRAIAATPPKKSRKKAVVLAGFTPDSEGWFDAVAAIHRMLSVQKRLPRGSSAREAAEAAAARGATPIPGVTDSAVAKTIALYHSALEVSCAMDTEDVIHEVRGLFDKQPAVAAEYTTGYRLVLLDPIGSTDSRILSLFLTVGEPVTLLRWAVPGDDGVGRWETAAVRTREEKPVDLHDVLHRDPDEYEFVPLPTLPDHDQPGIGGSELAEAMEGEAENEEEDASSGDISEVEASPCPSSMLSLLSGTFREPSPQHSLGTDASSEQATVSPPWPQANEKAKGVLSGAAGSSLEDDDFCGLTPDDGGSQPIPTTPSSGERRGSMGSEAGSAARSCDDERELLGFLSGRFSTPSQHGSQASQATQAHSLSTPQLIDLLSGEFATPASENDAAAASPQDAQEAADAGGLDPEAAAAAPVEGQPGRSPSKSPQTFSPGNGASEPYATPQQRHAARIVIGYLRLALNVRDNAAFARVFDAPSRGLGALGYTRICTTAQHQKISAYQSVMSFVTRLRLGGQGYRPDEQHVLHEHGAALRNLVDAMGTLQVVITEQLGVDTDEKLASPHRPSAPSVQGLKRALSTIARIIAQAADSTLKSRDVSAVTQRLLLRTESMLACNGPHGAFFTNDWLGTLWSLVDAEVCTPTSEHRWTGATWCRKDRTAINPSWCHLSRPEPEKRKATAAAAEAPSARPPAKKVKTVGQAPLQEINRGPMETAARAPVKRGKKKGDVIRWDQDETFAITAQYGRVWAGAEMATAAVPPKQSKPPSKTRKTTQAAEVKASRGHQTSAKAEKASKRPKQRPEKPTRTQNAKKIPARSPHQSAITKWLVTGASKKLPATS